MTSKIETNAIKCKHCGTIVVSTFRHDFSTHSCEPMRASGGPEAFIAADGGQAYLRRLGNREDWEEATVWIP